MGRDNGRLPPGEGLEGNLTSSCGSLRLWKDGTQAEGSQDAGRIVQCNYGMKEEWCPQKHQKASSEASCPTCHVPSPCKWFSQLQPCHTCTQDCSFLIKQIFVLSLQWATKHSPSPQWASEEDRHSWGALGQWIPNILGKPPARRWNLPKVPEVFLGKRNLAAMGRQREFSQAKGSQEEPEELYSRVKVARGRAEFSLGERSSYLL